MLEVDGDVRDELAIRTLLARLAQLADTGPVEAYLALLTDDAVWEMPDNPAIGLAGSRRQGHDEIAAGVRERTAAGLQGAGSDTMHWVGTVAVNIDEPAEATARSYFQFYGTASTQPTLRSMGRYHDRFRKDADGWKLAHRTITFG